MQKQQKRRRNPNVKFHDLEEGRVPVYQTPDAWISYPEVDPRLPEGATGASAVPGGKTVIIRCANSPDHEIGTKFHEPLPYPMCMKELEVVDENLDINLETGEVTSKLEFKVLDEYTHWFLRLMEYENRMKVRGMKDSLIKRNLTAKIKQLKLTRGLDMMDTSHSIPADVKQALEYMGVHV